VRQLILALLVLVPSSSFADEAKPIVVEGRVPDENAKQDTLRRMRLAFPGVPINDRLEVGGATALQGWTADVGTAISSALPRVAHGTLTVNGGNARLEGKVADEAARAAATETFAAAFRDGFVVDTALQVDAPANRQKVLDRTLGRRTVQFESGSAVLTLEGTAVLDEMAAAIAQVGMPSLDIIGHTDAAGDRQANILLSMARADAVKAHLGRRGIEPGRMIVSGRGPDQPAADNATATGRARNRRIEFLIRE